MQNGGSATQDILAPAAEADDAPQFSVAFTIDPIDACAQIDHVCRNTKLFMDRCYALVNTGGWSLRNKKNGIVMAYGDSDPFNSGAVNALRTFQHGFNYVGAEIVGFIYGSASDPGEIRQNE